MNHIIKRFIILSLCLSLTILAGCTSMLDEPELPSNVTIGTTAPTSADENDDLSAGLSEATDTTSTHTPVANNEDVTIAETVIYDENGICITATELEDTWAGYEVKLLIENNSANNILVTADSLSINGYMSALSGLYANVAAGKSAYESLNLSSSTLDQANIDVISNIQFLLDISDADSWTPLYTSDLVTLLTSAKDHTQNVDDSGEVVYDKDGIRVICKGLKQDIIWDGTIVFFIENNSDKTMNVYAEDVSVNGFMCSASLWSHLRNGTMAIDGMTLINLDELNVESIDDISNVEFKLRFVNEADWLDTDSTDVISLDF